jgi:DNA-binding NarL/FixJ family response regulator
VTVHVAVVDPLPVYQQGVAAALSAIGHVVETPEDPVAWARQVEGAVVLLTLISPWDWELLGRLRDTESFHLLIALIEEDSAALGLRAVRSGARSVILRQTTTVALQRTVEATIDGQAVLPAAVVSALATGAAVANPVRQLLIPEQVAWLRRLASGSTVAQVARSAGYSERAMYRLLQALYREMGARTRIEAIIRARDLGWLHLDIEHESDSANRRTYGG